MKPTDERGFTLVETMVAMVILIIGLVSLAELLAVSLRMQQLGRNETAAVRIAQDKLDWLETGNFDLEPSIQIGGSLTADVANYNDSPLDDAGVTKGYHRRWLVEAGPDGSAFLRQVTIRVIPDVGDRRTATPYDLVSIIRR